MPEESHVATQGHPAIVDPGKGHIQATPYDIETPLPGPALLSKKEKGKDTQDVSKGTTSKPAPRPPPTVDGAFHHFLYSLGKAQFIGRPRVA